MKIIAGLGKSEYHMLGETANILIGRRQKMSPTRAKGGGERGPPSFGGERNKAGFFFAHSFTWSAGKGFVAIRRVSKNRD